MNSPFVANKIINTKTEMENKYAFNNGSGSTSKVQINESNVVAFDYYTKM